MLLKKKNRFRPLYKQFIKLRENVQNRSKILEFKKKKWERFQLAYEKKLNFRYKLKDQNQHLVSRDPIYQRSYQKNYRNNLQINQKFKLFYGGMLQKFFKKVIKITLTKKCKQTNKLFLNFFENRLDIALFRSKFSPSVRNARQLILHNKILVNNKSVRIKSYLLKSGDLITINSKYNRLIRANIERSTKWPLPPSHFCINYRTLQIVFKSFDTTNFSRHFFSHLNLEQILTKY